jgi:glycosyltransferase involved in cell wall biosynthesis
MPLKVAILTADKREPDKDYANPIPAFGTAPAALLQGLGQLPEVEVHVVSCLQQPAPAPEKIGANIWYHGLHVPKIGWLRTLYQGCIRAFRKTLKEIKPDIVHGQGTERDNGLGAIFSGYPNVLTIHGNMRLVARIERARPFTFNWLAARLETFTVPRSAGVVCITNYTQQAVAGLARRTWVVPNAVDEGFFEVEPASSAGEPVVLCVGQICVRKNQNAFIRALDPLAARTRFKVLFLGAAVRGDAYAGEFFQLIGSRPWCAHIGFASRDKLKGYLRDASLLALPSLEDNCPMVVLEAMAAGVPVLAAKVGGVPDLVAEGKNGLFCDPLDPASMSAGVRTLLENPARGRELAAEARRQARERFHPQAIARRHVDIYREVLGSARTK